MAYGSSSILNLNCYPDIFTASFKLTFEILFPLAYYDHHYIPDQYLPENDWVTKYNVKNSNYFSYNICDINLDDYKYYNQYGNEYYDFYNYYSNYDIKNCKIFQMDFWIEEKVSIRGFDNEVWKAKVIVYDGNVTEEGYMYFGKNYNPYPITYDENIEKYVTAFEHSEAWLTFLHIFDQPDIEECIRFWCE